MAGFALRAQPVSADPLIFRRIREREMTEDVRSEVRCIQLELPHDAYLAVRENMSPGKPEHLEKVSAIFMGRVLVTEKVEAGSRLIVIQIGVQIFQIHDDGGEPWIVE